MSQDGRGIDLETSLGYLLKEASSALRAAMEEVLRPLGMSVTRYSCLELLAQRPGLSNSELARGAFVTRQSMNVLLQALEREGYVTRPAEAPVGKVLPTRLTPRGRRSLEKATVAVRSVEVRMLAGMTEAEQSVAFRILKSMIHSLRDGDGDGDGDAQLAPRRTPGRARVGVQPSTKTRAGGRRDSRGDGAGATFQRSVGRSGGRVPAVRRLAADGPQGAANGQHHPTPSDDESAAQNGFSARSTRTASSSVLFCRDGVHR